MVKRIFDYFKLSSDLLSDLHNREAISLVFLWIDSIWALLRHGCLVKQYVTGGFYLVPSYKRKDVFTQRRLEYIIEKYNDDKYIHYLKNKNEFNEYFKEWVKRRWLWSKKMNEGQLHDLFIDNNCLFIKPLDDQEGHGIRIIEKQKTDFHRMYEELKTENVLIEEPIIQHPLMYFNNSAVNTVRVITCLDSHGNPHILRAALRVGIGNSIVDNFTAGGALYDVDVKSGRIDNRGIGHDNDSYIFHPGTTICMLGFQIPNWNMVIECVKKAASKIPQCRFIGWDVAITSTGVELIEGNHNPGLFTMESVGTPFAFIDSLRYFTM